MERIDMRPLTRAQYAKTNFRRCMRALSYPEKVHCVIEMQKRLAPILALRGIIIKPWEEDEDGRVDRASGRCRNAACRHPAKGGEPQIGG